MSALSNGFSMITAICRSGTRGMSFTEIVNQTGVSKASAHRLLRELVRLGALEFNSERKRYCGGLLLARLGGGVIGSYDLRARARPALEQLHERSAQVATLGILGDGTGVYIDKIESDDFGIRLHSEIGKSFPLHCTAMGKVLLAYAEPAVFNTLSRRTLKAYTPASIINKTLLREHLARVRAQGFAIDNEEITLGLVCVAAPIFGPTGDIAGAMSSTCPLHIARSAKFESIKHAVVECAGLASGSIPDQASSVTGSEPE